MADSNQYRTDDNTFWIHIWRAVIAAATTIGVSIAGCTAYESKRIADAVEAGKDPIEARCGIAGTVNGGGTICAIRAAK